MKATVEMNFLKATKRTFRFTSVDPNAVVTQLYVQKSFFDVADSVNVCPALTIDITVETQENKA